MLKLLKENKENECYDDDCAFLLLFMKLSRGVLQLYKDFIDILDSLENQYRYDTQLNMIKQR